VLGFSAWSPVAPPVSKPRKKGVLVQAQLGGHHPAQLTQGQLLVGVAGVDERAGVAHLAQHRRGLGLHGQRFPGQLHPQAGQKDQGVDPGVDGRGDVVAGDRGQGGANPLVGEVVQLAALLAEDQLAAVVEHQLALQGPLGEAALVVSGAPTASAEHVVLLGQVSGGPLEVPAAQVD
jgi:hypothetical protein